MDLRSRLSRRLTQLQMPVDRPCKARTARSSGDARSRIALAEALRSPSRRAKTSDSAEAVLTRFARDLLAALPQLNGHDAADGLDRSAPGQSAIERLPFDAIAAILMCADLSTTDKLAIAACSRAIRNTVFSMPLFWATVSVENDFDVAQLAATLERTGTAPLRVQLGPHYPELPTCWGFDAPPAARLLLPQVSRLRSLYLRIPDLTRTTVLTDSNLLFEQLVDLHVTCVRFSRFAVTAPRLRHVTLSAAAPLNWSSIIPAAGLIALRLSRIPADLVTQDLFDRIFSSSEQLEELKLLLPQAAFLSLGSRVASCLRLRELILSFSFDILLDILQGGKVARIPFTSMSCDQGTPRALLIPLFSGIGELGGLIGSNNVMLLGTAGKSRMVASSPRQSNALEQWECLCRDFAAISTLRYCCLTERKDWETWAPIFSATGPPVRAGFTLHVRTACFPDDATEPLPPLRLPSLALVVLRGSEGGQTYARVERAVRLLASGILLSDMAFVNICVCPVLPPRDPATEPALRLLRPLVWRQFRWGASRLQRWDLCDHAAVARRERLLVAGARDAQLGGPSSLSCITSRAA